MGMHENCNTGAPSLTVLLIEDVQGEREGLGELLTNAGLRVVIAANGFEGMRLAVQQRPDVILMDLGLPGMDGVETMRHLKRERTTAHIPVIALTGQTVLSEVERICTTGFSELLTKPIDLARLEVAIRQAAGAK
jgi:CheY-like chemotaxis protein